MGERGVRGRRPRAGTAAALAVLLGAVLPACGSAPPSSQGSDEQAAPRARQQTGWDTRPASLAAVGDSITRGFDACSVLADCPEASWATGSDPVVRSLALRLLGERGAAERSWNHAVSGARAADLPAQVERAVQDRPELLTVMVGANDACRTSTRHMTKVKDFRKSVEKAMEIVREELPRTQVYMASVPDLKRLWSEGRTSELGKQVWALGICRSMLSKPDAVDKKSVKRRAKVHKRVKAYNRVLAEVCGRDRLCRTDGGAVFDFRFTGTQLSPWDWFHPSKNGQAHIARIAYRAVTAKG
ncbi:SGNH/GDSL hydrolase family protein [Streptomyces albidoflavus]|uniref:SGNH/GDSL hydrolase family protein n=1 Tax=Streptomyces albidoflavus TaxID=1886 RepID=UPI0033FBA393